MDPAADTGPWQRLLARANALWERRDREILALAAGAALPFAFAPFDWWPLAILCPAVLMHMLGGLAPRRAAVVGAAFGVGCFGAGTWWLYISIQGYGGAPAWLALLLIVLLVALMASYYAGMGALAAWLLPASGPWRWYFGLPALWLLVEWFRGWFISGFPWMSLGYSQTGTVLGAWAPVLGVHGLSALLLLQAGALLDFVEAEGPARIPALLLLVLVWGSALWARDGQWTVAEGPPVSVAVVQGAVPQDEKWLVSHRAATRELYERLNAQAIGARLVVWPEAALPELVNDIPEYLAGIQAASRGRRSDVLMGVVRADEPSGNYYNSVMALTAGVAFYDKRHLVPFAEYFPVPSFVRSWLRLMSLPYSDFAAGAPGQQPLRAGGMPVGVSICYEDAYPGALRAAAGRAAVLVNVTNDAWFGRSPARYQHLQISRMLAMVSGRYLVRAGNDGVSAIIGPRGDIKAAADEFRPAVLNGTVIPRRGLSPYIRHGDWPVLGAGVLALALACGRRLHARRAGARNQPK